VNITAATIMTAQVTTVPPFPLLFPLGSDRFVPLEVDTNVGRGCLGWPMVLVPLVPVPTTIVVVLFWNGNGGIELLGVEAVLRVLTTVLSPVTVANTVTTVVLVIVWSTGSTMVTVEPGKDVSTPATEKVSLCGVTVTVTVLPATAVFMTVAAPVIVTRVTTGDAVALVSSTTVWVTITPFTTVWVIVATAEAVPIFERVEESLRVTVVNWRAVRVTTSVAVLVRLTILEVPIVCVTTMVERSWTVLTSITVEVKAFGASGVTMTVSVMVSVKVPVSVLVTLASASERVDVSGPAMMVWVTVSINISVVVLVDFSPSVVIEARRVSMTVSVITFVKTFVRVIVVPLVISCPDERGEEVLKVGEICAVAVCVAASVVTSITSDVTLIVCQSQPLEELYEEAGRGQTVSVTVM
jgi:hypothetical protein